MATIRKRNDKFQVQVQIRGHFNIFTKPLTHCNGNINSTTISRYRTCTSYL